MDGVILTVSLSDLKCPTGRLVIVTMSHYCLATWRHKIFYAQVNAYFIIKQHCANRCNLKIGMVTDCL